MHQHKRIGFSELVILIIGVVMINTPRSVFSAQEESKKENAETDAVESNKNVDRSTTIHLGPDKVRLPSHSITVNVNGDDAVCGRRIKITIRRRGGMSQSRIISLDTSGDAEHRFQLGSNPILAHGHYTITVTKEDGGHEAYASEANWCFDGTEPASDSVTIDASHRNERSEEFTILYSLKWGGGGVCW